MDEREHAAFLYRLRIGELFHRYNHGSSLSNEELAELQELTKVKGGDMIFRMFTDPDLIAREKKEMEMEWRDFEAKWQEIKAQADKEMPPGWEERINSELSRLYDLDRQEKSDWTVDDLLGSS